MGARVAGAIRAVRRHRNERVFAAWTGVVGKMRRPLFRIVAWHSKKNIGSLSYPRHSSHQAWLFEPGSHIRERPLAHMVARHESGKPERVA
jgi:hypothetical protein